jgi:hypothetical protein
MLFILAMDPLQRLLDMATQQGVLSNLLLPVARWRTSMYADDAAIFINPTKEDIEATTIILHAFGTVSGLHINLHKNSVHPIRCQEADLGHVLASFPGTRILLVPLLGAAATYETPSEGTRATAH